MRKTLTVLLAAAALALLQAAPADAQEGQVAQSYVVQKGDTLNGIAKRFYGKANLGQSLWRANRHLVPNPNRLTPGDTIYIFPETTLALKKPVEMPPEPEGPYENLYVDKQLLNQSFPKFISLITNTDGRNPTRVRIRRVDPRSGEEIDQYFEVRVVGEILSSNDRGFSLSSDGPRTTAEGRLLLSTRDQVFVRFTEDLAKILDSDTYDDPDPYFRSYPVYTLGENVLEPNKRRADYLNEVGRLLLFKGTLTVDARIEGVDSSPETVSSRVKRQRDSREADFDPLVYHATITYCEDALQVADKVVVFVPLDPGPERRLDPPYVEPPDTYVSPGK